MDDLNPTPIYDECAWDHGFAPMGRDLDDELVAVTYSGHGIRHGDYRADVAL